MPFVKIEIVECFGARRVYLHRLYLHAEEAEDIWRSLGRCSGFHADRAKKRRERATGGDETRKGRPVLADVSTFSRADSVGVSSRLQGTTSGHRAKSLSVSLSWSPAARITRSEVIGDRHSGFVAGDSRPLGMTSRSRSRMPSGGLQSPGPETNSLSLCQGTARIRTRANVAYQLQPHIKRRDFAAELRALDKLIRSPIVEVNPSSAMLQRPSAARRTLKTHRLAPSCEERRVGFSSEGPRTGVDGGSFFLRSDDSGSNGRVGSDGCGVLSAADLRTSYPSAFERENTESDAKNDECGNEVTFSDGGSDDEARRCSRPSTEDSARKTKEFRDAGIDPAAASSSAVGAVLEKHLDRNMRMTQTGGQVPTDDDRAFANRLNVGQRRRDPTVISSWGGDMSQAHTAGSTPAWQAATTRQPKLRPVGAAGVFNEPLFETERGSEALFPSPEGYESVAVSGGGDGVTHTSHDRKRGVNQRESGGVNDADDSSDERRAAVVVGDASPSTLRHAVVRLHQKVRARQLVTARLELQNQLGLMNRSKKR